MIRPVLIAGKGRGESNPASLSLVLARCGLGIRTVHEILPLGPFTDFGSFSRLEKLKQDFGNGTKERAVFDY